MMLTLSWLWISWILSSMPGSSRLLDMIKSELSRIIKSNMAKLFISLCYTVKVDIDYSEELHAAHNSIPLAPHQMSVTEKNLSPYALECTHIIKGKKVRESTKLTWTFLLPQCYIVHAANLTLYLKLGMKLVCLHIMVAFQQFMFLETYIDFCTIKCTERKTKFHKWLFKAFSNSNVGQLIEQI
jgi:hypothetical protein